MLLRNRILGCDGVSRKCVLTLCGKTVPSLSGVQLSTPDKIYTTTDSDFGR
jgi:hypothetical protein